MINPSSLSDVVSPSRKSAARGSKTRARAFSLHANNVRQAARRSAHLTVLMIVILLEPAALAASYEGTVAFGQRLELSLPVSGIVKTVEVAAGQRVSAGQRLLALGDEPFQAAVSQAEAELSRCGADRIEIARDYDHAQQLYERGLLSNVELENAKLKSDRAEAACRHAQSRVDLARYELEHSSIDAPFDGWVLDVRVRPGEGVASTLELRPLLVIASAGDYVVRLRVPVAALAALAVGRRARITVADRSFDGRIATATLEPVGAKNGEAQYEIGVAFSSGGVLLRGGQSARVEFP